MSNKCEKLMELEAEVISKLNTVYWDIVQKAALLNRETYNVNGIYFKMCMPDFGEEVSTSSTVLFGCCGSEDWKIVEIDVDNAGLIVYLHEEINRLFNDYYFERIATLKKWKGKLDQLCKSDE